MHTDVVYEVLHPFHLWAWIAAACALALAAATASILATSRRLSRRWWLGISILILCLLAVAFGARSRAATYDLRPIAADCYKPPVSAGCEVWAPQVVAAQQRIAILGIALLVATVLSLALAIFMLLQRRRAHGSLRLPASFMGLLLGIFIAGCGAFLLANGIADWIAFAYLADITRAGDSLGQIPLYEAIITTLSGVVMLMPGLAGVIGFSMPQRDTAIPNPPNNDTGVAPTP